MDGRGRRRWTRLGITAISAHVFYELACGAAMPLASYLGPVAAATGWATGTTVSLREAGRRPSSADRAFALLNGMFLSAVLAHFLYWPTRRVAGLPWLTECEGLRGRAIPPYNVILYLSAVFAVGGLVENREGRMLACAMPVGVVPLLMAAQHHEFGRLRAQARSRPGWWNRRLQQRG